MSYKEVLIDLKNNRLNNLYLFYGIEHYLIECTLHAIKEKIISKACEKLNYDIIDGKEASVDEIINACETLPFMGEKRMVIVKDFEVFYNKRVNISDRDEEKLIQYFSDIPDTTCLFFIVPETVDKRKKIVKAIANNGKVIEFNKLTGKDIYKWIEKSFNKFHKEIAYEEMNLFLDTIGYLDKHSAKTLKDLENEIKKISSYTGDRRIITRQDINLLSSRPIENNIFALVEAIGTQNGNKALILFNEMLINGEAEIKILYMIIRQFRLLFQIKILEVQGYTPTAIASKLGMQQFAVKRCLKQAANFELDVLRKALHECLRTDEYIKKGKIDQRLGIELLISKFTR